MAYKFASVGIQGKIGLWIANWLQDRTIKIRWKTHLSRAASVNVGVPQGSVLSPFLFMIYMRDIFETLEDGVRMLTYADDIVLYATGDSLTRTLRKLQETVDRVTSWCTYWKLQISPEKCTAVNFSRKRGVVPELRVYDQVTEWRDHCKFLGILFTRTLSWKMQIQALRDKANLRMNLLKRITNSSRGACSRHLIRIVNSLIRGLIDYACFLYVDLPKSVQYPLEIVYNAALRLASGLPKWTPIPVLRRELGQSSMAVRTRTLTRCMAIKLISNNSFIPLSEDSHYFDNSHEKNSLCNIVQQLFGEHGISSGLLMGDQGFTECVLDIVTDGLAFQTTGLPDCATSGLWEDYRDFWLQNHCIIATDASKDEQKVAIAAINHSGNEKIAQLVHYHNSVFTAEALALSLALNTFVKHPRHYALISDSLSVLTCLKNITLRSPCVIKRLHADVRRALQVVAGLRLIWVPGHKGITPNEEADRLAKHGPFSGTIHAISPEDLISIVKRHAWIERDYEWLQSDYSGRYTSLDIGRQSHRKLIGSRELDVAVARWRGRSVCCNSILFKINLAHSPLCDMCLVPDTPDHRLLFCVRGAAARRRLFAWLGVSTSPVYDEVIAGSLETQKGIRMLGTLSRAVLA